MKKVITVALTAALMLSLASFIACSGAPKGDPLVGTWSMVDNPTKSVTISKEGEQYFYEGSQGKTPANKVDEHTLVAPMGPIEVTIALNPETGVLSVSFMGENYTYKKAG